MNTKKQKGKLKTLETAHQKIPTRQVAVLPDEIPARLKEDVCRWKREIDKHREYFMENGINPFREAHEILLSFVNNFDTLAGMKAK